MVIDLVFGRYLSTRIRFRENVDKIRHALQPSVLHNCQGSPPPREKDLRFRSWRHATQLALSGLSSRKLVGCWSRVGMPQGRGLSHPGEVDFRSTRTTMQILYHRQGCPARAQDKLASWGRPAAGARESGRHKDLLALATTRVT